MRILLTTIGSYGDLHPYMAIGIELRERGHQVTIATSASYEQKVRSEGLEFATVRPDISLTDGALMAYVMDARRGSERIVRYLAERTPETYQDTLAAARGADVLVTHPTGLASVVAAEKLGVRWVSSVLAPLSFFSAYDPPVPAPAPWLAHLRVLGPWASRGVIGLAKWQSRQWVRPVAELRRKAGLGEGGHPLFEGQHSPQRVLALFSRCLAAPQLDWPPQTVVTGFPFFDRHHEQTSMPPQLERFLADGPAPLVFSLGSSAVGAAGDFYRISLDAARRLGMRAVFLTGQHAQGLPPGTMEAEYAPHSELFPRAAAIVHHGGIGTMSQAMRSGRPMLVVPFSHDQFDNGARVRQLGMGEVLYRSRYNAQRAEQLLGRLVEDSRYAQAGAGIARLVQSEDGVKAAADAIIG